MKTKPLSTPRDIQYYLVGAAGLFVLLSCVNLVYDYFSYAPARVNGWWPYAMPMLLNALPFILLALALFAARSHRHLDLSTIFSITVIEIAAIILVQVMMMIMWMTSQMTLGSPTASYYEPLLLAMGATALLIYRLRKAKQW